MQNTFSDLLSGDNAIRQRAEAQLNEQSTANPAMLASNLIQGMQSSEEQVSMMCLILIKKYFLDVTCKTQLSETDLEALRQAVMSSIEFEKQPLLMLKRKADVLSKVYYRMNKNEDLFTYI